MEKLIRVFCHRCATRGIFTFSITDMLTFSCILLYMHAKIALIPVMVFLFFFGILRFFSF